MQRFRRFLLIAAVIAGLAVLFHLVNVHGLEPIRAQVEQHGKSGNHSCNEQESAEALHGEGIQCADDPPTSL